MANLSPQFPALRSFCTKTSKAGLRSGWKHRPSIPIRPAATPPSSARPLLRLLGDEPLQLSIGLPVPVEGVQVAGRALVLKIYKVLSYDEAVRLGAGRDGGRRIGPEPGALQNSPEGDSIPPGFQNLMSALGRGGRDRGKWTNIVSGH